MSIFLTILSVIAVFLLYKIYGFPYGPAYNKRKKLREKYGLFIGYTPYKTDETETNWTAFVYKFNEYNQRVVLYETDYKYLKKTAREYAEEFADNLVISYQNEERKRNEQYISVTMSDNFSEK